MLLVAEIPSNGFWTSRTEVLAHHLLRAVCERSYRKFYLHPSRRLYDRPIMCFCRLVTGLSARLGRVSTPHSTQLPSPRLQNTLQERQQVCRELVRAHFFRLRTRATLRATNANQINALLSGFPQNFIASERRFVCCRETEAVASYACSHSSLYA